MTTLPSDAIFRMNPQSPTILAGPCSAESEEQVLETARRLADQGVRIFRAGIWKPRTKPGGFEGVGAPGLAWLQWVKRETGMLLATEVATRDHVGEALKAGIDILWIGARTTVNPFAVQEIADALRGHDVPVLVKNPVNPDLELWIGAFERLRRAGLHRLGAIHRGFSSGGKSTYRNEPLWDIPLELRRRLPELPLFCDPSHISGKRERLASLSRQALDLRFDGLMIESHYDPDTARSDAGQQLTPEALGQLLGDLLAQRTGGADTRAEEITELRSRIDLIDEQLLELLARRMSLSGKIGTYKKEHYISALQPARYRELVEKRVRLGESLNLNPAFVKEILHEIHTESVRRQIGPATR